MKARALRPNDTIAIIAPASAPIAEKRVTNGVRYFERLGYRVKLGKHVFTQRGHLAGTDRERLADLHAAFADPKIRAIFFIRGGYGTLRLLPEIDYNLIARNPKIIVGYSDATSLFHALYRYAKLTSCFFGPMPGVDIWNGFDPFAEECFWRALTWMKPIGTLPMSNDEGHLLRATSFEPIIANLIGGNLTVFSSICGTPYLAKTKGAALLFEDVDEAPYRVDRYFAQLRAMGILKQSAAILLGQFTGCEAKPETPSLTMKEIITDYFAKLDIPVAMNLPFGHVRRQWTLPFGAALKLSNAGRSRVLVEVTQSVLE